MNIKKINRGLVLGAVLIVGVTSYVIYDTSQFSGSKPEIEQLSIEYLGELGSVNVLEGDEFKTTSENIINKYWDFDSNYNNDYSSDKNYMFTSINETLESEELGKVYSFDVSVSDISVSKYGPHGAVATVNYRIRTQFSGERTVLSSDGMIWLESGWDNNNEEERNTKYEQGINFEDVKIYFNLSNGEWKIVCVESYGYMDEGLTAIDAPTDEVSDEKNDDDIYVDFDESKMGGEADGE